MCGVNTPMPNVPMNKPMAGNWQTHTHTHLMCHIRFPLSITKTHRAIKERMQSIHFTLNDVQFGLNANI